LWRNDVNRWLRRRRNRRVTTLQQFAGFHIVDWLAW